MMRSPLYLLLLALAGCTAAQCDPSQADFFSGVGCSVGGGYNQRTTALQNTLANEQGVKLAAQEEQFRQSQAAASAEAQVAALRRQVDRMQRRQAQIRRQLAVVAQRRGAEDSALRQAQAQLAQIDQQIKQQKAHPAPSEAAVRQLEHEQNQLVEQMSHL